MTGSGCAFVRRLGALVGYVLVAAVLAGTASGAATAFTVTITAGPAEGEQVSSSSVTFTFAGSGDATYQCTLDSGSAASCDSGTVTYTQLANGQHSFEVDATETSTSAVATATRSFTVAVPPVATITSNPTDPSSSTDATFSFTSDQSAATFECSLDGGGFASCTSPVSYHGLAPDQQHTFAVRAVSSDAGPGAEASYQWQVAVTPTTTTTTTTPTTTTPAAPPESTITGSPSDPTASHAATFHFTSNYKDATFECSLDGARPSGCSSPVTYTNLSVAKHTFAVVASSRDVAGKTPATFSWTIQAVQPALETTITDKPADPSTESTATFEFTANVDGATFECSLDGSAPENCTSPKTYDNLSNASHTFEVRARAGGTADSSPATSTWTVAAAGSSSSIWPWVLLAIVALALLGVLGYLLYRRRHASRLVAWQRIAVAAPPPDRCHGDGEYVWRRDCRLLPGPRQIETVTLRGMSEAGGEIRREAGDDVASGLNRAIEAARLQRGTDVMRESLAPVAIQLLGEAGAWRDGWTGGKITVGASLVGGRTDCEFRRFHCVVEGAHSVWKPVDKWRAVVDDEAEEIAGEINMAGGSAQSDRLVDMLLAFVGRVDVPGPPPRAS
jgi:hypothetical protein